MIKTKKQQFVEELEKSYGIKISGGYKTLYDDTEYFRAAVHLDIGDEGIDRAVEGVTALSMTFQK